MTTIHFRECRRSVSAELSCRSCGKIVKRTFTGTATYNPFNNGEPPEQALADARRQRAKAEESGITCKWCEDAPQREALLSLADGKEIPERRWGNATDVLIDRGNIREERDLSRCGCCGQSTYKLKGYTITDKGWRIINKTRALLAERERGQ